jgi:hypothetical protein
MHAQFIRGGHIFLLKSGQVNEDPKEITAKQKEELHLGGQALPARPESADAEEDH